MSSTSNTTASNRHMRGNLLGILSLCALLGWSSVHGFTSKPRYASSLTSSRPTTLFSATAPASNTRKKKLRTRFHYSKKNIPAIQQKQKSVACGEHPLLSLNLNLDSLAKSGAAPRAQSLLERIQALHSEGYYQQAPDVVSYNSVLNAWALSTQDEQAVQRAVELFEKQVSSNVRPTLVTYNTLILAFSKRGQAQDAQHILEFLLEQSDTNIRPDTISFNSVLHAWAVRGDGEKAEQLLQQMMALAADGDAYVKADTISFNTVLHAYRNNPRRAQLLLEHMEYLYQAGNDEVEPDVYSYTSVIRAWASTKNDKHAVPAVMDLLHAMEHLSSTENRPLVAPNTVTYSCVIQALAKSRQAGSALQAQEVLERMLASKDIQPDVVVFTNVIDAWARDSSQHGAQRALDLLEQMKSSDKKVQPNAKTYTAVFRALAKRGEYQAAEKLLRDLKDPSSRIQPSIIHYNCVLDAHAKSKNWNKADQAMTLLQRMEQEQEVVPDIITYNSVLSACANTYERRGKRRALQVCVQLFQHPVVLKQATPITYFLLFKAIGKLLPQSDARRWSLIQQGFKLCCQAGLLSERVLTGGVKRACTSEQYASLLPTTTNKDGKQQVERYSNLPKEWTRNSQQQKR